MSDNLRNKMTIVTLNISRWGNYKQDRKASKQVTEHNKVNVGMAKVTKRLINPSHLKEIDKLYSEARAYHDSVTQPWQNVGTRIIPAVKLWGWLEAMNRYHSEFDSLVGKFINTYSSRIDGAKEELGDLFNANEYPKPEVLSKKFAFHTHILPITNIDDFRINIPEDLTNKIKSKMKEDLKVAEENAKDNLVWATYTNLTRLQDTLIDVDKRIYKSVVVDNINITLSKLHSFNYDNDNDLTSLYADMSTKIGSLDIEQIKSSATYRSKAIDNVKSLLNDVQQILK